MKLTKPGAEFTADGLADLAVGERVEAGAEGAGAGRRADEVLQDHVPADDEGDELAHCDVAVHVGRSRCVGHPHAELRVARSCGDNTGG